MLFPFRRYAASPFAALLAPLALWTTLGFDEEQLTEHVLGDERLFTPALNRLNECIAARTIKGPAWDTVMEAGKKFYYKPTSENLELNVDHLLSRVSNDPQSMVGAFRTLVMKLNKETRFSILNSDADNFYIRPRRLMTLPGGYLVTQPSNLFPLSAQVSLGGGNMEVVINSKMGHGTIVDLRFPESNPFGMTTYHSGVNVDKAVRSIVKNAQELGVRDINCVLTCDELHMSRAIIQPFNSGKTLVAVFPRKGDLSNAYQPVNRLSAGITYNRIRFLVSSMHTSDTFSVSDENYAYKLVFEIRPSFA